MVSHLSRSDATLETWSARWLAGRALGEKVASLLGGPARVVAVRAGGVRASAVLDGAAVADALRDPHAVIADVSRDPHAAFADASRDLHAAIADASRDPHAATADASRDPHAACAEVRVGGESLEVWGASALVRRVAQRMLGGPDELDAPRPLGVAEQALWSLFVAAMLIDLGAPGEVWPLERPLSGAVRPSGGAVRPSGGAVRPSGSAVRLSGDAVRPSGDAVRPSGGTVRPSGGDARLSGDAVRLSGGTVRLSGGTVRLSGGTVRPSGGDARLSGDAVRLSGDAVRLSGGTVRPSGGAARLSGDAVRLSGDAVRLSGDAVRLSGEIDLPGLFSVDVLLDVSGSVSGVSGSVSGASGSVSDASGSVSGASGSASGMSGSASGVSGSRFTVSVVAPRTLLARRPADRALPDWALELPIVVARCVLPRAAVRTLAARDVVIVERGLALEIFDGEVRLAAAPRAMEARVASGYVRRTMAIPDEAHVELTVQLGTVRVSLRDAASLAVGQVISLGRPLVGPFEVRAAGRLVGQGELVDVDGEVGVRMVSVAEAE